MRPVRLLSAFLAVACAALPAHAEDAPDALPELGDESAPSEESVPSTAPGAATTSPVAEPPMAPAPVRGDGLLGAGFRSVLWLGSIGHVAAVGGALAGTVMGLVAGVLVATGAALAVRSGGLDKPGTFVGIQVFFGAPLVGAALGSALGYAAARALAPWVVPPGDGSARTRVRTALAAGGVDVLLHAIIVAPVVGLAVAAGVLAGWSAAPLDYSTVGFVNGPANTGLPTPAQSALVTGIFYAAATAAAFLPAAVGLVHTLTPAVAFLLAGSTGAPAPERTGEVAP